MLFDFGQPTDGLIQMAFVVEDLDAAMARFSDSFRVGPWTVLRDFAGENPATGAHRRRHAHTWRSASAGTCNTSSSSPQTSCRRSIAT